MKHHITAAALCVAAATAGGVGTANANTDAAAIARQALGAPYVYGAAGPRAFDCSGLIVWAYNQIGVALPHSSQALARGGHPVARDGLQPGDVITFYANATHAAIYTGNGMVIHASTYGRPVAEVPLSAAGPFHNARRY